jgi:hypothetical protein
MVGLPPPRCGRRRRNVRRRCEVVLTGVDKIYRRFGIAFRIAGIAFEIATWEMRITCMELGPAPVQNKYISVHYRYLITC